MSLLRDIQNDVINNGDISVVLRKCKVLAARLGNKLFEKWVDEELNGYKDIKDLPDYRMTSVFSKGNFSGFAGRDLQNADIPLGCIPKEYHDNLSKCYFKQPIAAYVALLKNSNGENYQEQWLPDLVAKYGHKIYRNMNCLSAWKVIPNTTIVEIIEVVRNRILNFVLEIEKDAPDAGESTPDTQLIPQKKVTQVFNTTIYGNVGNIAEGNKNVTQTATITVIENDIESLKSFLSSIGIPKDEVNNLEMALSQDPKSEVKKQKSLGSKVLTWVGSITTKLTTGSLAIAKDVGVDLIVKAIFLYYGIAE